MISTLAPTFDPTLKEDRSICYGRTLGYHEDKTKHLTDKICLVFVSFKKSLEWKFASIISSWIIQTVVVCYQTSYHEALFLNEVRAYDLRDLSCLQ